MATQLEYRETQAAVPTEWQVPADLDVEFASSVVRVDGAGAAGPFYVVLDVLSQDGKLIAQSRTSRRFGAGDTGVVSFAPF